MLLSLLLLAQENKPEPVGNPLFNPLTIMLGLFLIFWLMVIRPNMRRQEQERQSMINTLEKNDRVLTVGGIYATVISVSEDKDEMIVRIEDDVKMKMTRSSISRNLTKEEKAKEAAQQQKASKEPAK